VGAKTAVLVYADGEPAELLRDASLPDVEATRALIARTSPGWDGARSFAARTLHECVYPDKGTAYAGVFPGIEILCDRQVMADRPSQLPAHLLQAGARRRRTILHVMQSATDWFAFATWENGTLIRSLSLSPGDGIIEDIGAPLEFERPYWAGEHPLRPSSLDLPGQRPYPLPFHPLELGAQAAMRALLGFVIEGHIRAGDIDGFAIRLAGFHVPDPNPITEADLQEFLRTHTRKRYRLGPGGTLVPIEG
jgi:hypothetical protein